MHPARRRALAFRVLSRGARRARGRVRTGASFDLEDAKSAYVAGGGDAGDAKVVAQSYGDLKNASDGGQDLETTGAELGAIAGAGACAALGEPELAPICGEIGGFIGEKFAELIGSVLGEKDPCEDNPASCVATNEYNYRFHHPGAVLEAAWEDAVMAVATKMDPSGWFTVDQAPGTNAAVDQARAWLPKPVWPATWPSTLSEIPAAIRRASALYAKESFALSANYLAASRKAQGIAPPKTVPTTSPWPTVSFPTQAGILQKPRTAPRSSGAAGAAALGLGLLALLFFL